MTDRRRYAGKVWDRGGPLWLKLAIGYLAIQAVQAWAWTLLR